VITIACCLWDANPKSWHYSTMYDESWAEKLYRGFARNLTVPFRFVCFTDHPRDFAERGIEQELLGCEPDYGAMIEPLRLNEPMILVGLDTIVTGNCDSLAAYCLGGSKVAVPLDPFYPDKVCNGVMLVPAGMKAAWYDAHDGENDMDWTRRQDVALIDELFPGQVLSFKRHVRRQGLPDDCRICYFHGELKPHELSHVGWIDRLWHESAAAPDKAVA
jgi:hypothetical protein